LQTTPEMTKTDPIRATLEESTPQDSLLKTNPRAPKQAKQATMEHPWTLEQFKAEAPEIVTFVALILALYGQGKRHILIKAPVKSGKRIMVEVIRLLFGLSTKYVTSLNRRDVKDQQAELERYGIKTHLVTDVAHADEAVNDVRHDVILGNVVLCFDECDYGSGAKQILGTLFGAFLDDIRTLKLYFSATAHETAVSKVAAREDYAVLEYVPTLYDIVTKTAGYCGAAYFLKAGLVFEPRAFFEYEDNTLSLTQHAIQVVRDSIKADRHIGVVRVAGKGIKMELFKDEEKRMLLEERLNRECPGKPWEIVPIDEKTGFRWEHRRTQRSYTQDTEKNILFVIKQTCGRGTDLKGWHSTMAFWHDARPADKTNLNTSIQAALRPSHYSAMYPSGAQPIRLYVDRRIVQVAVDDDMEAYLGAGGKEPARTKPGKFVPYDVSEDTFDTPEAAREWAKNRGAVSVSEHKLGEDACYPYRGKDGQASRRRVELEETTRASTDLGYGVATADRIFPVLRNGAGSIGYLVVYRVGTRRQVGGVLRTTKKSMYEIAKK